MRGCRCAICRNIESTISELGAVLFSDSRNFTRDINLFGTGVGRIVQAVDISLYAGNGVGFVLGAASIVENTLGTFLGDGDRLFAGKIIEDDYTVTGIGVIVGSHIVFHGNGNLLLACGSGALLDAETYPVGAADHGPFAGGDEGHGLRLGGDGCEVKFGGSNGELGNTGILLILTSGKHHGQGRCCNSEK